MRIVVGPEKEMISPKETNSAKLHKIRNWVGEDSSRLRHFTKIFRTRKLVTQIGFFCAKVVKMVKAILPIWHTKKDLFRCVFVTEDIVKCSCHCLRRMSPFLWRFPVRFSLKWGEKSLCGPIFMKFQLNLQKKSVKMLDFYPNSAKFLYHFYHFCGLQFY